MSSVVQFLCLYAFLLLPLWVDSQDEVSPDQSLGARIDAYVDTVAAAGFQGAVIVASSDGTTLYRGAFGTADDETGEPFTPDTAVDIGSNSKAMTAVAILKLKDQGKLELNDTITDYIPAAPPDKQAITIHQLLTHTAGFPDEYAAPYKVLERGEMEQQILAQPLRSKPGAEFFYADMGYALLAAIAERAAGQSFRSYVRENLFGPIGLKHTGFLDDPIWKFNGGSVAVARGYSNATEMDSPADLPKTQWSPLGAGTILSTVSDGVRWHRALVEGELTSKESTEFLFNKHVQQDPELDILWYGYGWNIFTERYRGDVIAHSGATASHNWYSQYLIDDGIYIVAASNRIVGTYEDKDGDGNISNDEIIEETMYGLQVAGNLGRAIHMNDFTILPRFAKEYLVRPTLIQGGTFTMGTERSAISGLKERYGLTFRDIYENEVPTHEVTLNSFRMDRTEVTNEQYSQFLQADSSWRKESLADDMHNGDYLKDWLDGEFPGEKARRPVVYITWHSAQAYCRWADGRLPTEAEWEYAARSGSGNEFPWGNQLPSPQLANYHASGVGHPVTVASFPPNDFGLYDLAGNVWEFLLDEWQNQYQDAAKTNPLAGGSVSDEGYLSITGRRAVRGGSYGGSIINLRTHWRDSHVATNAIEFVGFRCAYPSKAED